MSVVLKFARELGPYKLMALLGGFVLLLLIIGGITLSHSKKMAVLYTDLESSDSSKIVQILDGSGVAYETSSNGSVIRVPQDSVSKLRMLIAQEGLPVRGSIVGYEIFDKEEALGTTNFMQNIKLVRALEGELSRTIATFDQIEKVRVHLVIPQREIFSREKQEPRASIILKLKNNAQLNKADINSISHLVATAVPGLDIDNVTIVDTKGRSLKLGGTDDDEIAGGYGSAHDQKILFEANMKRRVEDLLSQMLGTNKATVEISADLNFDRTISNSETYDPDGAVARSVQSTEETEKTPVGDADNMDVSVANNLPGGFGDDEAMDGLFATSQKRDEITNYEISRVVQNKISETGTVSRLSVAVVVDGNYNPDPNTGKLVYTPRTAEEMAQITSVIKTAVGYQEKRDDQIQVVNMQFSHELDEIAEDDNTVWLREELPSLVQTLILAVVVTVVVIAVIRPIAIRAFDTKGAAGMPKRGVVAVAGSVGGSVEDQVAAFTRAKEEAITGTARKVNDTITAFPDEAVMIMRKWLNK